MQTQAPRWFRQADERSSDGDVVFVPAGTEHNLVNMEDDEDLKVATIYSPPEYAEGTVHRSKADAMAAEVLKKELAGAGAADTTTS
jgi:mannose-6-phosphate isomerase-like protein (cupin superfamily)